MNQILKNRALRTLNGRWGLACIVVLICSILILSENSYMYTFAGIQMNPNEQAYFGMHPENVEHPMQTYTSGSWKLETYTWTVQWKEKQPKGSSSFFTQLVDFSTDYFPTIQGVINFPQLRHLIANHFLGYGSRITYIGSKDDIWESGINISFMSIWNLVVAGSLILGLKSIYLRLSRYGEAKFRHLFTYFTSWRLFVRGVMSYILPRIYLNFWLCLFLIPGVIKYFSYAMTNYILIDHPEYSVNQAVTKSRELMDGHKLELFRLMFSFIGWFILALMTGGIGFIWLTPYYEATKVQFYLRISGERDLPLSDDLM